MPAYYNEIDAKAAAWLRELIKAGHIADGEVDERDIQDVTPADIRGFSQCHFFAGIGVWSYALRRAGWADDRPVWTGSCPCQPFSAAGKGGGFDDERHVWPAWHWLIEQCRPAVVFGEQVASKDAEPWIDLVQADLEGLGYAVGADPFPSAGVGAPHIRDRLYWLADADGAGQRVEWGLRLQRQPVHDADGRREDDGLADAMPAGRSERGSGAGRGSAAGGGVAGSVADADDAGSQGRGERGHGTAERSAGPGGLASGLADAESERGRAGLRDPQPTGNGLAVAGDDGSVSRLVLAGTEDGAGAQGGHGARDLAAPAGPVNGLWRDADWLFCRDGNWRAVEPGTFPLAHGAAARVGRLRGYGNAINAEAASTFIGAYLEAVA